MKDPYRPEPEREVLPRHVSERVLARAAELDAAQKAGIAVAELRAAATEAGISPSAFDTALDEIRGGPPAPAASVPPRRRRIRALFLGISALILAGTVFVGRVAVTTTAPTVEQAFLLRCLPPGEAAELVRPMLAATSSQVRMSPTRAPRVLTVRAMPEQMGAVRALLDRQDAAACEAPGTTR